MKKITVNYKGKKIILSESFINKNNAMNNLKILKSLFLKRMKLYDKMEKTDKQQELRILADKVLKNEYLIQEAYNLKRNNDYFRFWELPKCSCPKMDNREMLGLGKGYIYSSECIIHGNIEN